MVMSFRVRSRRLSRRTPTVTASMSATTHTTTIGLHHSNGHYSALALMPWGPQDLLQAHESHASAELQHDLGGACRPVGSCLESLERVVDRKLMCHHRGNVESFGHHVHGVGDLVVKTIGA